MNTLTLSLGGDEKTLVFGKVSFLKHLGRVNDKKFNLLDPRIFGDPEKSYQSVLLFVHAGLLCGNHKDLTAELVEQWVDEMPVEKITDIQYAGFSALTGKTVEELKNAATQAVNQNGTAKVNY
jgi:hypothetical protein